MKGFFRRDLALIAVSTRFYVGIIASFAVGSLFLETLRAMLSLYVMIFGMSATISLFNYDETSHWMAYGAAMPNGRRDMVNARYCVALLCAASVGIVSLVVPMLTRSVDVGMALLYMGISLVYSDLMLPLCFRFGNVKGRVALITVVAILAAILGAGGAIVSMSTGSILGKNTGLTLIPIDLILLAGGAVGCAASWKLSQAIVAQKDL